MKERIRQAADNIARVGRPRRARRAEPATSSHRTWWPEMGSDPDDPTHLAAEI